MSLSTPRLFSVLTIAAACACLAGGCKSCKPGGNPDDSDVVTGAPWDGAEGGALTEQPSELGTRVTDTPFQNVLFNFDQAAIERSEVGKIDTVANYLKRNPGSRVVMEGHCDERGTFDYNMALGERRAHAVRAYLLGLGIEPARMFTKSYGEEKPADSGHSPDAWRANRRVEFALYR